MDDALREQELFHACLARPEDQWNSYLKQACGDNRNLRVRLDRLLAAHAAAGDATLSPPVLRSVRDEPGTIGPYRLVRLLGEGGMGSVYEAEQTEPVQRRVALKIVKLGMLNDEVLARFSAEKQALAVMDHPYVAKVFDAGEADNGCPYFVMELVDGIPLVEYCDRNRFSVRRRVELLILICQAVQHAHQKGVVHRDLKPSNVLVSGDPSTPIPKIIDFGIAKAIGLNALGGSTIHTRGDQAIGTAAYMSPEQAGYGQLDVDTRSDVYSLGVMSYELLASCLPADPKQLGYAHFLSLLANGDLPVVQPSKRIFSLEGAVHAAAARDTTTTGLRRELQCDLDWIVIKALDVDRARRYETAEALAGDLRRYLGGSPVSAHPPTFSYQLRKFIYRHKVQMAAAALLILALIAGTAGTTAGMVRARRAEASARSEAATAERYSTFLVNMFETAAPEHSKGREIAAREILDRGAARIRKELAGEPLLEARLLATIGWVYTRLGHYPEARPTLDEAVALARGQGERARFDLAQALVRRGQVERYLDEPAKAESDDREAIAILERAYGPNHVNVEPAIAELALLLRTSDPEQALRLYRRSYALQTAAHGDADGGAAVLLQNIGSIHARASRFQDAKEAYERALPLLQRHFGERDPHVGSVIGNLSFVYRNLGEYEKAFEMAQRGLEIDTAVSGPDHPDVGIAWLNLARISDKLGDQRSALEQIDRAIAIFDRRLSSGHPLRIQAGNFKAGFLIELGRLGEARNTLGNSAATESGSFEARQARLSGQVILAEIARLERRLERSQELARGVLANPVGHSDSRLEAGAYWAYAYSLAMQAQTRDAEAERRRALDIESSLPQGNFAGVVADAKYHLCARDAEGALAILSAAVAKGFHDPVVLNDPTFAPLRENPNFVAIAAELTPRFRPSAAARR